MTTHPRPLTEADAIDVIDLSIPQPRLAIDELLIEHRIVVSVGTDHHPFDRVVDWVDQWLQRRADPDRFDARVSCVATVQHGTSRVPRIAGGSALMAHDELQAAMTGASAIVTHGGPATIRDARSAGRRPIVVPRDPQLGEHVDDHQIRFTRMLAEHGDVVLCRERDELFAALDHCVADEGWTRIDPDSASADTAEAIARVGAILDDVMLSGGRRRR